MGNDLVWVLFYTGLKGYTKASGLMIIEMVEGWNAIVMAISMKANSKITSLMGKASILGLTGRFMKGNGSMG